MKQINEYANILTLRKISSLFKSTFKNVDELLNIVLETAQVTVDAIGFLAGFQLPQHAAA